MIESEAEQLLEVFYRSEVAIIEYIMGLPNHGKQCTCNESEYDICLIDYNNHSVNKYCMKCGGSISF